MDRHQKVAEIDVPMRGREEVFPFRAPYSTIRYSSLPFSPSFTSEKALFKLLPLLYPTCHALLLRTILLFGAQTQHGCLTFPLSLCLWSLL